MSSRRIEALRAIAERPGTEAEGIAAREALKRLGRDSKSDSRVASRVEATVPPENPSPFEQFLSDYGNEMVWGFSILLALFGQSLVRWLIGL